MRIFSKISAFLLALAIGLSSFGQTQVPASDYTYHHSEGNGTPLSYIDISNRIVWGVINLDSGSSLVSVNFYSDSKEDKKNSVQAELVRESVLEKFASIYLSLSKDVESSPTIRDLLYPFHFYF